MAVVGKVQKTSTRYTTYGTMYNVQVDGTWYGCGKTDPGCREGDLVKFQSSQKGNYHNVDGKVEVLEQAAAQAPQSGGSAGGFVDRQAHIEFQSSRSVAAQLVDTIVKANPDATTWDPEAVTSLFFDLSWRLYDEIRDLDQAFAERYGE